MIRTLLSMLWARKRRLASTGVAVVLGVAFLTGTLILAATTKAGFGDSFRAANSGIDVVVRSSTLIGTGESRARQLIDESMVAEVRLVDGVAAAEPSILGSAQLMAADGVPVGGDGPPTIALNWIDDPELNWLGLVEGRVPVAPDEVVVDRATAALASLAVGDRTSVLIPDRVPVTIVGTADYGGGVSAGGATFVAFETSAAQRLLTSGDEQISSVRVRAADGVNRAELEAHIAATVPDGIETLTGAELTAEQRTDVDSDFIGFFRSLLLAFAGIALVVACFSIHNTFSILVAQRTRESALMRALGASRRQVIVTVVVEALAVGALATAIGFGAGIGIAKTLRSLIESGLDMPRSPLVIGSGAIVAGVVVGIGTTLFASAGPAILASRVAPLAALRDVAFDRSGTSAWRVVVGTLVGGAGAAALVTATSTPANAIARAGLGALGLIVGAVVLGPIVARPAAAALGGGPAALRGAAGRLARRNAMRNPRRTAASASALMVGTAVVGLFATFGASIKASLDETVDENFAGDLIVLPEGFSGARLSPQLAPAIAALPEVEAAVGTAYGPAVVDGSTIDVAGTDVASLATVFDIGVVSGSVAGFTAGDVVISTDFAEDHDLTTGDTVSMTWADGSAGTHLVGAVYDDRMTFGDVIVPFDDLADHLAQATVTVVLVGFADGVDFETGRQAVTATTGDFGAPAPMDRDEYLDAISEEVDGMLYVVYGLLGVAVVIALLGIGNTLSLSIHERTRELGLLRAVGQDRSQLRSSVRWESVIVAVFGTFGGVALGSFLGWGLVRALNVQEGFGVFALPIDSLGITLALAAGAGVLAAVRPARRAARVDILGAIAAE